MTKAELVDFIAEKADLTKADAVQDLLELKFPFLTFLP